MVLSYIVAFQKGQFLISFQKSIRNKTLFLFSIKLPYAFGNIHKSCGHGRGPGGGGYSNVHITPFFIMVVKNGQKNCPCGLWMPLRNLMTTKMCSPYCNMLLFFGNFSHLKMHIKSISGKKFINHVKLQHIICQTTLIL